MPNAALALASPSPGRAWHGRSMTAQPANDPDSHEQYEVIHLGRKRPRSSRSPGRGGSREVERRAPAELLEEAEIEATLAAHRVWVAAGRSGTCHMTRRWLSYSAASEDRIADRS